MRNRVQGIGFRVKGFSIILSSLFLILSFPNFNLWIFAWIGFLPLFFAVENQRPLGVFLISYLVGILFFLGTISWLIHVTLPGMMLVVLYLAIYFGLFGLVLVFSRRMTDLGLFVFVPSAWVTLEWLRSTLLTGFGWALLGYSQSYNLAAIQIADIVGVYGVSFLIMAVNVALFLTIKNFRQKKYNLVYVGIALLLVYISAAYGILRLNNIFTGERIRVAVIQGNIPQGKKWDFNFRDKILTKYESLTIQAAGERPDLIVWPETSVPGYLETDRELLEKIKSLAKSVNIPILVGAPREDENLKDLYYNSAILFSEEGRIREHYDKIHLVPFGEYVPFKKTLSFVDKFAKTPIGDFSKGRNYTVFKFFVEREAKGKDVSWRLVKKVKFACLICFEDIFPHLTRQFVKNGAVFLINITNDAWFGNSSSPYQHAQSSVFRAVENRVNVVRAANTGYSCFIDQKGRVVDAVEVDGKNLFVDGFKTHEIVLTPTRTFYTAYGDVFAFTCIFITVFYILLVLRRKKV